MTQPRPSGRDFHPAPAPAGTALGQAAQDIHACRRCGLWRHATQAVFGEGPATARIMLVGEQPGDQEDLAGRPFVGPAGRLLDRVLAAAGLDRDTLYITNAVKHFKYEPRGKKRLHRNPDGGEIQACRFWLGIELEQVRAPVVVLLGASAAKAVLGRAVTISRSRGMPITLEGRVAFVTVHPSYLLRLPDEGARAREYAAFVADLRQAGAAAV